ncbi:hypothetical protein ALC57_00197 [Trachymyrmex cornetzi]|uniref:Peptidase aspartic putative domain-containing protein n=1 Tax=Trachymyrmex cornetzi TaxID=471704 RepID=A0A151JSK5_9HYME|nr:hypothetical protein ALC57_00197 [Trachymyrmex cornetzi]
MCGTNDILFKSELVSTKEILIINLISFSSDDGKLVKIPHKFSLRTVPTTKIIGIPSAPTLAFRYMDSNLHQITHRPIVRILERRYPLTVTGYKYLNIGINVKLPSYVTIILRDSHGKEIPLSPDIWRELLEQKHVILSLLQYDENNRGIRAPMYVGNLTLRFGRINNLPILRLEISTARLSMSKSTVLNIFNLEYYVNRLISSLTAMTDNVDKKFSRLLAIAFTVTKSANMLKTMYDDESFDRNDILDCELIALVFGEY